MRCECILGILKSLYPAFNFALVTYYFIVLPFGVFLSSLWLFLVLELGLMVCMFIVMFKPIKSLCKAIKDAVNHNQKIQQTLNERRNKWKSTLKEIENKQTRQGVVTEQPKKNLGSGTIFLLPDQNLINNVGDGSNNIITPDPADNLNSNINEENNEINDELITDTNKNLMTDNISEIKNGNNSNPKTKSIVKKRTIKSDLYNKIGTYGCPNELNLESESEEEI